MYKEMDESMSEDLAFFYEPSASENTSSSVSKITRPLMYSKGIFV